MNINRIPNFSCCHIQWLGVAITFLFNYSFINAQNSSLPPQLPPIQYILDLNDDRVYDSIYTGKEPIPKEGKAEFEKCLSSLIRYPYEAYEKNIKGVLILEVYIDHSGLVTKIEVLKSLSKECDDAAKLAFSKASQYGYAPLMINGKGINYKMKYPVLFWLE